VLFCAFLTHLQKIELRFVVQYKYLIQISFILNKFKILMANLQYPQNITDFDHRLSC